MILFLEEGLYDPDSQTLEGDSLQDWVGLYEYFTEHDDVTLRGYTPPSVVTKTVASKIFHWAYQALLHFPDGYWNEPTEDIKKVITIFENAGFDVPEISDLSKSLNHNPKPE